MLSQLIGSYPNGLTDRGWDWEELSSNIYLSSDYVMNNLDKPWIHSKLLSNPGLNAEVRLYILKNADDETLENSKDLIADLEIVYYLLDHRDNPSIRDIVELLIGNQSLSVDSLSYLFYNHRDLFNWNNSIEWCNTANIRWLYDNPDARAIIDIKYFYGNIDIDEELADELILISLESEEYQLFPFSRCSSQLKIELLNDKRWIGLDIQYKGSSLNSSDSAEYTKSIIEAYPELIESDDINLYSISRIPMDEEMMDRLLVSKLNKNGRMVSNPSITEASMIRYIRLLKDQGYDEWNSLIFNYIDRGSYIHPSVIQELINLNIDMKYHGSLCYIVEDDLINTKWRYVYRRYTPERDSYLSIEITTLEELKILSGLELYGSKITCPIDHEIIEYINNSQVIEYINWEVITKDIDLDMILYYPNLPWDNKVLSSRQYQPSHRMMFTKRANN